MSSVEENLVIAYAVLAVITLAGIVATYFD